MTPAHSSALGRPFWMLWTAFTASNLADGLSLVALPLLANELTSDARLVAGVLVFQYLPFLVIGLPAGVVIDRFDRRWVAVVAQSIRVIVVCGLGWKLASGGGSIGLLFLVAFLIGSCEVLVDGGVPALVRTLVGSSQLEVANARMSATQTVSNAFVGPPVGALLFGIDRSLPFVTAAAVALISIGTLSRLPGRHRAEGNEEQLPLRRRMVVGVRYVWGHPVLRPLVIAVGTFSFVGAASNGVFVILASERFGIDGVGFGLLVSVDAVASVLSSFFVAGIVRRRSHSWSMRLAVVCFVVGALLFGLFTFAAIAFVAAVINGVSQPTWNVVSSTVRQRLVPDEVFGRMMTAYLFIAWGVRPLGALLGGVVAEAWGAQWVSIASAVVVASLFVSGRKMFRLVDESMSAEVFSSSG